MAFAFNRTSAWLSSGSSFHLQQNGNVRFVCHNPLSAVYIPFCERVRALCTHRLFCACSSFVFRAFVVRFPPVLQAFTACTQYVQRSFWAGVCAEQKRKRNFLIKSVAFGCTQSGGAPHFRALARTLLLHVCHSHLGEGSYCKLFEGKSIYFCSIVN